jgi:predicted transcriptional regulator
MTLQIIESQPKRRDKIVIMAEIINLAKKGISKTHIMFKANLSFSQLNQYIESLSNAGLIEKTAINGKVVYKSTPKGLNFYQSEQQIIALMQKESDRNISYSKMNLNFKPFNNTGPYVLNQSAGHF